MDQVDIQELLTEGIGAAKQGQRVKACDLLLKVVDADPENEKAWIWLSSVVESGDEKRICLENVLVLNPDNEHARRGLDKLGSSEIATEQGPYSVDEIESQLIPNARPVFESIQKPIEGGSAKFTSEIKPDDIWELDIRLCAFCAGEIEASSRKCPTCRRK